MLDEIFILKEQACIFHRSYKNLAIENIDLTSGFFQAILSFAKELGESQLDSIDMGDFTFHFETKDSFMFVLSEEKGSNLSREHIEDIMEGLSSGFHKQLAKSEGFDDPHFIDDFGITCDEIIQHRPIRQGFPILLNFIPKPFFTSPTAPVVFITHENQDDIYLLQHSLKKNSEKLGSKMSRDQLRRPHIIYLPNIHHLAYIFPFSLNPKPPVPTHLLCFLTKEKNWFTFYQLLPLIGQEANRILPTLTKYLQVLEKNPLAKEIKDQETRIHEMLANWADLNQYVSGLQASLVEEFFKAEIHSDTLTEEQTRAQFNRLLTRLGSDIDKVIFALLSQRQTIFVGDDRTDVEQTLSALLSFYPHSSVTLWAESPKDQLLVGTSPNNLQYYNKKTILVVDLRNNQVRGGEKNSFCAELIEETKQMAQMGSIYDARVLFLAKISSLFGLIMSLLEVFSGEEEEQHAQIQNILMTYPTAMIQLILRMSENFNLLVAKNVERVAPSIRLLDFMGDKT